jgi:hypothetical protein
MMFNIKKIITRIFGRPEYSANNADLNFEVNIESLSKELSIQSKAKKNGGHELPKTESIAPDEVEKEIQSKIYKLVSDIHDQSNNKLVFYDTSIAATSQDKIRVRLDAIAANTKIELEILLEEAKHNLINHKGLSSLFQTQYDRFREKNKLTNEPIYAVNPTIHYVVIAFIIIIESVANTSFFAQGSQFGLFGGFSESILVSAINVLLSVSIFGPLFRYYNHIRISKKLVAFIASLVFITWVPMFNLVVAHYRDLLQTAPDLATTQAWSHFINGPFNLADIKSWLLFSVGVLASIFAVYKGYKWHDPYPGYSNEHRKLERAKRDYKEYREHVINKADQLKKKNLVELEDLKNSAHGYYVKITNLIQQKRRLIVRHNTSEDSLVRAGESLIFRYRTENMKIRETTEPSFFNETWKPEIENELVTISYDRDTEKLDIETSINGKMPELIQSNRTAIDTLYNNFFGELEKIDPGISKYHT